MCRSKLLSIIWLRRARESLPAARRFFCQTSSYSSERWRKVSWNSRSLEAKWKFINPTETPALRATRSTVVPEAPWRAMTAMVALIRAWRRRSRMGSLTGIRSLLLARRVEEHAVGGPAAHHLALDLLFFRIPDLHPHLASELGEGGRHLSEGDVLLQHRRPQGRGGEA